MAAKDLQIMRTRAIQVEQPAGMVGPSGNSNSGNPVEFVLGALGRQWPLVIVAILVSSTAAWFYSQEYGVRRITARVQLNSKRLPVTNANAYSTPGVESVAELLQSEAILGPVGEKHGVRDAHVLSKQFSVATNNNSGSLTLEMKATDEDMAILLLDDIGEQVVKAIRQRRTELLAAHAVHTSQLLLTADKDLMAVRTELLQFQVSDRANSEGLSQQKAEYDAMINSRAQMKAAIDSALRQKSRIQRNQNVLAADTLRIRKAIYVEVLNARRRQAEAFGKGLTESTRSAVVKAEILARLTELDVELSSLTSQPKTDGEAAKGRVVNALNENSVSVAEAGSSVTSSGAAEGDTKPLITQTAGAADANDVDGSAGATVYSTANEDDFLKPWIEKVMAVGSGTLGNLDSQVWNGIESSRAKLVSIADNARRLDFDAEDNHNDLEIFNQKLGELEATIDGFRKQKGGPPSMRAMELESELELKGARYTQLLQRLDQINEIKDCPLSEYVSGKAKIVPESEKSDRGKLFAFVFLGCGVILMIPSALFEAWRLRPSPVNVVSRRWNLPVLGVQSSGANVKAERRKAMAMPEQELRLMALRIQQSLFRPDGRVVLFSGLDHEESPIGLIRSLAVCLSNREESVLMIQCLPCQVEHSVGKITARKTSSGKTGEVSGHPGVAEFLAGDYEDASQLIRRTGVVGVDFLPGGCSVTASEAMASSRLTALIEQFRSQYSMILLCGPSTLHPADLQMVAARADGIVFTVTKRSLKTVYGSEVISDLIELGAPIIGFAEQPVSGKKAFPAEKGTAESTSVAISSSRLAIEQSKT